MTVLSINVNKFALLRNARGTDYPNLIKICEKCIKFGAQGITVHPRPDERHAKFSDIPDIAQLVNKFNGIEFNIEGYPSEFFIKEIIKNKPHQVTLVPDPPEALTSSFGWNCKENINLLKEAVSEFKLNDIRVSLFVSPSIKNLEYLSEIKNDRVELYTFDYAKNYLIDRQASIIPYEKVVNFISKNFFNIEINAGHDLNLQNLSFILKEIPIIKEVSIGHALVCDAFIFGLEKTVEKYKHITCNNLI